MTLIYAACGSLVFLLPSGLAFPLGLCWLLLGRLVFQPSAYEMGPLEVVLVLVCGLSLGVSVSCFDGELSVWHKGLYVCSAFAPIASVLLGVGVRGSGVVTVWSLYVAPYCASRLWGAAFFSDVRQEDTILIVVFAHFFALLLPCFLLCHVWRNAGGDSSIDCDNREKSAVPSPSNCDFAYGEYLSPRILNSALAVIVGLPGSDQLTARELAVMERALCHVKGKVIARELEVAESTVSTLKLRAFNKLGIKSLQDINHFSEDLLHDPFRSGSRGGHKSAHVSLIVGLATTLFLSLVLSRFFAAGGSLFLSCVCIAVGLAGTGWFDSEAQTVAPAGSKVDSCVMAIGGVSGALYALCALGLSVGLGSLTSVFAAVFVAVACTVLLVALSRARRLPITVATKKRLPFITCLLFGMTGLSIGYTTLTPPSVGAGPLLVGAICLLVVAGGISLAAWQELVRAPTDMALMGNERALMYLRGRGASEIQARVALLTSLGMSVKGVCAALYMAPSSVSNCRSAVYRMLGASGREELAELLEREAGLDLHRTVCEREEGRS